MFGKVSVGEICRRIAVYCFGLFLMALGVSFSAIADLGMSPVNSIPYVLSEIFTNLSMGKWVIIIFSIYIIIQFLILGKNVQPQRVLQLLCTALFGYFTDFTNFCVGKLLPNPLLMDISPVAIYFIRLGYLIVSMMLIALGILFYLTPNLISLPGEGIMQVIAEKAKIKLHIVKVMFDITVSIVALIISVVYFKQFHGIREGTVIAALGVGKILGFYEPIRYKVKNFVFD